MDCQYLPLTATGQFSTLFLDYISQKETLQPYYDRFPTLEAFAEQAKNRAFDEAKRRTLVEVLERQYQHIPNKPDFSVLAQPNTFTVTTGHQLNIFTGPLYVLYKWITTVNLAKKLAETYPEYRFVPIYWLASEDHDFAEINHFTLFGKSYTWETEQQGAVGRMNPKELKAVFSQMPEKLFLFEEAYLKHDTLSDAVRWYVNELLGKEGLICLDADDADLKRLFAPVIKDELLHQPTSGIVTETSGQLEAMGYKTQVTPREINLFYLGDQLRERIVSETGADETVSYKVLNTELQFSQEELLTLLDEHPERFSPNVVLRPVYQEVILPNLAYIGGPSEVPYWLQLKGVFDHFQIPFPLLMPRNFALYVNPASARKMEKLGVLPEELFRDEVKLRRSYIERISEKSLDLSEQKVCLQQCFAEILNKSVRVDKSLEGAVLAEQARLMHTIDHLEKRLKKTEERNYETTINQLMTLKHKLFPNGGIQERTENYLNFQLNDPQFIQKLLTVFDPLAYQMMVLKD
ncbi:bacillithiol biosynthesis cysteine-adding enzyme BshC [Larkinella arboricola]|uniref:Putative cysteine ligase BshC n=1 Tax=Larkinella arboricola TaxID=643671 RepID=A0A327WY01_LARAB|nr:bacillithiol biosynthesis cysteine-adding enzyme BshC [Larkinella arboricola]RAJ98041.1 bacillithiol biosynthesis cysteine-adding enzyme BshC [Larkinella arboricola]